MVLNDWRTHSLPNIVVGNMNSVTNIFSLDQSTSLPLDVKKRLPKLHFVLTQNGHSLKTVLQPCF